MKNLRFLCFGFLFLLGLAGSMAQVPDTALAHSYMDNAELLIDSAKFDEALTLVRKAFDIYEELLGKEDTLTAGTYYLLGEVQRKKGELGKANDSFHSALNIFLKVHGKEHQMVAKTYRNIGIIYYTKGDFENALDYFKRCVDIQTRILGSDHFEVGKTYNNIGLIHAAHGEFKEALVSFKKAITIFRMSLGEEHSLLGGSYSNLGIAFKQLGDYDQGLQYYLKSLDIRLKNHGEMHPDVAISYNNIGIIYNEKGNYQKANEYYNKALEIISTIYGNDHFRLITCFNNIAGNYMRMGDYDNAILYNENALHLTINNFGEQHKDAATSYYLLGLSYSNKKNYAKALAYLQKSQQINESVSGLESSNSATRYSDIGLIYLNTGKYDLALGIFQKAIDIQSKIDSISTIFARASGNIGLVHQAIGNYEKAIVKYQKAISVFYELFGEDVPEIALLYTNIGDSFFYLDKMDLALENYKLAEKIQKNILQKGHPDIARTYAKIAYLYHVKKDYNLAFTYHDKAIQALEQFRQTSITRGSKEFNQSQNHFIFENAIHTNIALGSHSNKQDALLEAFNFAEKSKSNTLLEAINISRASSFSGIPDSLLDIEYQSRVDITFYDKRKQEILASGYQETDTSVLNISSKLLYLNQKVEMIREQLETNYPKYYQAKYDFSTVEVEDVQQQLISDDQSLIEYFTGDSSIFIFLIQKDNFEVHEIKKDFPLEEWVQQMTRDGIYGYYAVSPAKRSAGLQDKSIMNYTNAAQLLYEKLVAPIADKLTKDLIIIPDGVLGYMPFEALLTSAPPREGAFRAYPYLLKKHQISYCYSATLLQEMRQKKHQQAPTGSLLAMAPFYQGDVHEMVARVDTSEWLALRDSLAALPASGEEVAAIVKILAGTPSYGTGASLEQFELLATNFRILHLSTHGKADDRVGDYAYLAFGVPDEEGTFDKLYARDLYNYSLNADMVVLSACETGIGKLQRGEGIISLARAFAYAGAKSIFTTLWQVSDEKTRELMVSFYKNLKAGQHKDEALRNAKLAYLENNNSEAMHPFFWAGLIGVGDMSKLK